MAADAKVTATTQWERTRRVTVYDSPKQARYPSIVKTADGTLLVLFTRTSADAGPPAPGDLVIVRSTDRGETWSDAEVVYRGRSGEPRALGTMTALAGGTILAPFAEIDDARATSEARILRSADSGKVWEEIAPDATLPLSWWAPSGRLIEAQDGTLVMPVYGAASQKDLEATIHSSCARKTEARRGQTSAPLPKGRLPLSAPTRIHGSVSRGRAYKLWKTVDGWRWRRRGGSTRRATARLRSIRARARRWSCAGSGAATRDGRGRNRTSSPPAHGRDWLRPPARPSARTLCGRRGVSSGCSPAATDSKDSFRERRSRRENGPGAC